MVILILKRKRIILIEDGKVILNDGISEMIYVLKMEYVFGVYVFKVIYVNFLMK